MEIVNINLKSLKFFVLKNNKLIYSWLLNFNLLNIQISSSFSFSLITNMFNSKLTN